MKAIYPSERNEESADDKLQKTEKIREVAMVLVYECSRAVLALAVCHYGTWRVVSTRLGK